MVRATHIGILFGLTALLVGVRLSTADEAKPADLAELREAITTASKRGANLDEVRKALTALEKLLGSGFKPPEAKADAPKELIALRQAVEAAGRKGENVEEITKQLEAVEMKLLGRLLTAPKPVPPPLGDIPRDQPPPRRFPNDLVPPRIEFPAFPDRGGVGRGIDKDALQKAQELRARAFELLLKDMNDPKALEMMQQATELMVKALTGGNGMIAPELMFPDALGRVPDRFRLGVRMEKLTPVVVEQLGLEAGRGIAVTDVIAGSAAEKSGFKAHDIILEFAGKLVSDLPDEFNRQVLAVKSGQKVDAVVLRKGKKVELKGIELPEAARPVPVRPLPLPDRIRPGIEFRPQPFPILPDLGPLPGVIPGEPGLPGIKPLPPPPVANPAGDRNGRSGGVSIVSSNGNFTIKADQDGVKYVLQGTTEAGAAPKLSEITIDADGKVTKAESIEKVPEEYRPTVERLLKSIGARPAIRRDRDK